MNFHNLFQVKNFEYFLDINIRDTAMQLEGPPNIKKSASTNRLQD